MHIVVVGAGAVGGYCAARLIRAGHEVEVVEQGAHLAAIRSSGLRVQTPQEEFVTQPRATKDPAEVGSVDLVILAVQSQDTASVAGQLRPLIAEQTIVVPLQNNVDNPDRLAAVLGGDHVVAATIFIASSRPEPGLVRQLAEEVKIYVGELNGQESERSRVVARVLSEAGLPCVATTAVRKEMWIKFSFGIGFFLTGPLHCSAGEILDLEETRLLHWRLLKEVAAVAASQGVEIGDDVLEDLVETTRRYGNYVPSLVQELDEGRADEMEHMLRTLIRLGNACGVTTPMTEATLAFARFINQRNKRCAQPG